MYRKPTEKKANELSHTDMMEEALLQSIRSSSIALLELYKKRNQVTIIPQPIPAPQTTIRPQAIPTLQPKPQPPKKLHLEELNVLSICEKILIEIDDLLGSEFNEKVLRQTLKQSPTWNTISLKVDTESLTAVFSNLYSVLLDEGEEDINPIDNILNEIFTVLKNFRGDVTHDVFVKVLNKTASWNNLANQTKKEILKPLYSSFNSRRADFMRDVYPVGKPSGAMSTGTPTNKNDGGNKGQGVQQLGSPSKYSPVNNHGISNLDKSEAYGRTPANNMNNIHEVQNAPGSSRVIPQNSGFVNNASEKAKKVSELTQAILSLEEEDSEDLE